MTAFIFFLLLICVGMYASKLGRTWYLWVAFGLAINPVSALILLFIFGESDELEDKRRAEKSYGSDQS